MKRSWSIPVGVLLLAFALCMGGSPAVWAQPVYDLTIEGPALLEGAEGEVLSESYTCFVTHSGDAAPSGGSAQGWSLSLTADDAAITSIRTGLEDPEDLTLTDAAAIYDGGFNKSEVTTEARAGSGCEGKDGAVSAVVLSFTSGATLPADTKSSIAVIAVEATVPAEGADYVAKLYYVDGCKGVGQPVDNNVTHDGASVKPSLGETDVDVRFKPGPIDCSGQLALGFSAAPTRVVGGDPATLIDELVGTGQEGAVAEIEIPGEAGTAYAGIVSPYDEAGTDAVQGWSLAVGVDGDGEPVAAGLENTAGAEVDDDPPGYYDGGFNKTEIVDPTKEPTSGALAGQGPQGPGVVSAVVLSFTTGATLPKLGVESVLKLDIQSTVSPIPADTTVTATLLFKDGLQGVGQPVNNVATVDGDTAQYCNREAAAVTLKFGAVPPVNEFLRGNPNNDGKVNIADPIWIVNELFRGGPATLCQDAADANDDGSVDVSDVTYLIDYEFRGGSMPPAPFPDCGADPDGDDDGVTCEVAQDICG